MEKQTYFIQTFGCQMNDHDSAAIASMMEGAGYVPAEGPADAGVILVNTCAIREKAEQKAYSQIGRWRLLKKERPGLIIGVGGCMAQSEGEKVFTRVPFVDFVFGTQTMHQIPEMVQKVRERKKRPVWTGMQADPASMEKLYVHTRGEGLKAFITVMQGCDNYCSYCIVPFVRGRELSRFSSEIVAEARRLAASGVREITLLGQNVNSYGLKGGDGADFAELIRRVSTVEGIKRIRFTTSHPKDLTDDLIAIFAQEKKAMPHIHLPLQSGSDEVLKAMNRRYTSGHYLELVEKLRRARPDIAITTDLIVGFPGESDEDFQATLAIMRKVVFDGLFSFKFSPRKGTKAFDMADTVPEGVKEERLAVLQALQQEHTILKNRECVGGIYEVLVEGRSKAGKGQLTGRTPHNRIVNFEGPEELAGREVLVKVTRSWINSMTGELAE
jgi:tRNA-2-methylthio-N6-dimethylallyladenosine synthase